MNKLATLCFVLSSAAVVLIGVASAQFGTAQPLDRLPNDGNEAPTALIVLIECSDRVGMLPVPDTSQAFVTQLIRLADLSQRPVQIAVVFFGGQGVSVLGDGAGMPTAAYESLHQPVLKSWPKPDGGAPLERALERCVTMVNGLPPHTRTSLVLFSNGKPDSGKLSPDRYPDVREEMDRRLQRLHAKYQGNSPAFVQKILSAAEVPMQTPGTEAWKELYAIQVKAEFEKTTQHATALKEAGVRFLCVDYTGGIPELKQIHAAAGGDAGDYVLATPPSLIMPRLHALGLTALPRVIRQDPTSHAGDPNAFEKTWTAELDAVGEAALVTAAFDPPIADVAKTAELEAVFDGKTRRFNAGQSDDDFLLLFDSAGNVVAATMALDKLPQDGRVSLHYRSPSATLHVPGCTLCIHLRMSADLTAGFRPVHLPDEVRAPFQVSPNQAIRFVGLLRSEKHPQPYPVSSMEPVLRDRLNDREVRIAMTEDPQRKHVFVSDERRLARGSYDLELHVVLPSGSRIVLRQSIVLECQTRNEYIAIEIPLPAGEQTDGTSYSRAHLDFGTLGDAVMQYRIVFMIRTLEMGYPIRVRPSVVGLADDNGASPHDPWITFDQDEIHLEPGKPQPVVAMVQIPSVIEESIVDGRFEGRLLLERQDIRQPVPLRRFGKIAGVPDDAPVEPVTFTLTRPRIQASAPRGPRDAILQRPGGSTLRIPVSIWHPFGRRVILNVRHTSVLPREITALAQATFVDGDGRRIPSVRLVLHESCEMTQEVPDGKATRWVFDFEIDDDDTISSAFGSIVLSGPGLTPVHIPVDVQVRDPLLGKLIKVSCFTLAGVLACLALTSSARFWRIRRLRTGQRFALRSGDKLPGVLAVTTHRGEARLRVENKATVKSPRGTVAKPIRANHVLPDQTLAEVSEDDPCEIEIAGRKASLTGLYPSGDGHIVYGRITDGGSYDEAARNHVRQANRRSLLAAAIGFLGLMLFFPPVLAASQWVLDVLALS